VASEFVGPVLLSINNFFFYNFKNEGGIEEVLPWKEKSALAFGTLILGYCLLHSSFVVRVE
jgi:hypothetical protein